MATGLLCIVPGCGKPDRTKRFCPTHYARLLRGKDPFGPLRPAVPMCASECSVDGCSINARKGGMCSSHYMRFKRHGDPTAGGTPYGSGERWLREHASYEGDSCLTWPFGGKVGDFGYGEVNIAGKQDHAHRAMCILAHGEPPTPKHYATHSCGKGNEGCVSPRHLRWATPTENWADTMAHGTAYRGERCLVAKLTESQVREIRALKGTMRHREIAEQFGVSRACITDVITGKSWSWLTQEETA